MSVFTCRESGTVVFDWAMVVVLVSVDVFLRVDVMRSGGCMVGMLAGVKSFNYTRCEGTL